jgi:hypothetical protein
LGESNRGHGLALVPTPMNCSPRALPCPDFGNIYNSDATGLNIKGDRTAAKLSTTKTFIKFCNNLLGKSSLSAIGQETQPHNLHSLALLENESNPCGADFSPVQRCKLNTRSFQYKINPD